MTRRIHRRFSICKQVRSIMHSQSNFGCRTRPLKDPISIQHDPKPYISFVGGAHKIQVGEACVSFPSASSNLAPSLCVMSWLMGKTGWEQTESLGSDPFLPSTALIRSMWSMSVSWSSGRRRVTCRLRQMTTMATQVVSFDSLTSGQIMSLSSLNPPNRDTAFYFHQGNFSFILGK